MTQTEGGGRRQDLGFSPEQMETIRTELAKLKERYAALAREKQAARDRAGTVSPADLEFGKKLQDEWMRPRPSNEEFHRLLSQQIWAGKLEAPPPMPKTPKTKKPSLLKRLASRIARKRKQTVEHQPEL